MTKEQRVRTFAASLLIIGLGMAYLSGPGFLILPLAVGIDLFQSGFTGVCLEERLVGGFTDNHSRQEGARLAHN